MAILKPIDLSLSLERGLGMTVCVMLFAAMDDRALYEQLTAVKGIGKWSVDMFAMFHAGRRDILPTGDLAVRKGFQALYGLKVNLNL